MPSIFRASCRRTLKNAVSSSIYGRKQFQPNSTNDRRNNHEEHSFQNRDHHRLRDGALPIYLGTWYHYTNRGNLETITFDKSGEAYDESGLSFPWTETEDGVVVGLGLFSVMFTIDDSGNLVAPGYGDVVYFRTQGKAEADYEARMTLQEQKRERAAAEEEAKRKEDIAKAQADFGAWREIAMDELAGGNFSVRYCITLALSIRLSCFRSLT